MRQDTLQAQAPKLHQLSSQQDRRLLTVRVQAPHGDLALLVATAHLESGAEAGDLREEQLSRIAEVMSDDTVDGAVFALPLRPGPAVGAGRTVTPYTECHTPTAMVHGGHRMEGERHDTKRQGALCGTG